MNGKQIGGVVCLVLSALFLVIGISNVVRNRNRGPDASYNISYAVGSFLPTLLCLIVGISLVTSKPGDRRRERFIDDYDDEDRPARRRRERFDEDDADEDYRRRHSHERETDDRSRRPRRDD